MRWPSAAVAERQAAVRAVARAQRRAEGPLVASAVADGARIALRRIESQRRADADRQPAEEAHKGRDGELKAVRARIRDDHGGAREGGRQRARRADGAGHPAAAAEQIAARALEEFATEADALVAEYGPEVPATGADEKLRSPYVRRGAGAARPGGAAQARPARQGQSAGAGGVRGAGGAARVPGRPARGPEEDPPGPADRDQGSDERVQQVFTAAYEDVAREFEASSGGSSPVATAG